MSAPTRLLLDVDRLANDPATLAFVLPFCEELHRRENHPGDVYLPDNDPEGDQLGFHQSNARIRLLFGGNQSGKSRGASQEAKWWVEESHPYLETPRAPKIYVLSADYRTLTEGIYRHLIGGKKNPGILHEWEIEKKGQMAAKTEIPAFLRFKNGAQIDFISGDGGEEARKKLQAAAVDLVLIDEEIQGILWKELMARRLSYGGKVVVSATLQRSEEWLLDLEQASITGDKNVHLTRLDTRRAVARGHVSKDIYDEMTSYLSEEDQHVMLRGGSRKRQGLVYPEFCADHICEPFEIPKHWTRYCSIDPGRRTCAVVWAACGEDERVFVYREGYFHGIRYHDLARFIYESEGYHFNETQDLWVRGGASEAIRIRWIDPSAFFHTASGEAGVGTLLSSDYHLYTSPAQNNVHFGIERVHQLLRRGLDDRPGLRVFNTCSNVIKEFGQYRWVEDRGSTWAHERKDQPVKRHDHAMDALRYMVAMGVVFCAEDAESRRLNFELDKAKDLAKLGSSSMQERLENWWRARKANGGKKRRGGGGYIGGIGRD